MLRNDNVGHCTRGLPPRFPCGRCPGPGPITLMEFEFVTLLQKKGIPTGGPTACFFFSGCESGPPAGTAATWLHLIPFCRSGPGAAATHTGVAEASCPQRTTGPSPRPRVCASSRHPPCSGEPCSCASCTLHPAEGSPCHCTLQPCKIARLSEQHPPPGGHGPHATWQHCVLGEARVHAASFKVAAARGARTFRRTHSTPAGPAQQLPQRRESAAHCWHEAARFVVSADRVQAL